MTGDIVDSGGIDDHHCLSCLFIMMIHGIILISVLNLGRISVLLQYILFVIPPLIEWGLYCNHLVRLFVCPSVHTFVTDISASTGRNDFIFDIWLWHGDLYRVSPFQVYHTSTSCLQCDLQMNEWGYS
jgi:hypothetical protein